MVGWTCTAWGALLLVSFSTLAVATDHTVGGSSGWSTGVDYSAWASDKTFVVGDSLVFNYAGSAHNVAEVKASDYKSCSSSSPLSTESTGPTTIPLKTPGKYYFICGVSSHCNSGMKLAVTVAASSTTSPPSPPSTTSSPSPPSTESAPSPPSTSTSPPEVTYPSSSGAVALSPAHAVVVLLGLAVLKMGIPL